MRNNHGVDLRRIKGQILVILAGTKPLPLKKPAINQNLCGTRFKQKAGSCDPAYCSIK
jgi:hypothetical protein